MKNLAHTVFLLLCTSVVHAQAPAAANDPTPARDAAMVSYDRFEDRTTISADIRPDRIYPANSGAAGDSLYPIPLHAEFSCGGQLTKCAASSILFSYAAGPRSLAQCDALPVTFLADGARVSAGRCDWHGAVVLFSVSAEDFLKIAEAKTLEVKLGSYVWRFGDTGIGAIRSLASHVAQKAGEARGQSSGSI